MTFADLHFLRPDWLWLLVLLPLIWWLAKQLGAEQRWQRYLPKQTLAILSKHSQRATRGMASLFVGVWSLAVIAAAGPTWIKVPTPTLVNDAATVIILDLSPSMMAQDLKPDRLTRARLKIIDTLRLVQDGQIALVAYAGDAYAVSPLTSDPATIETLLPALAPSTMPQAGSNIEAAVNLATTLLRDAGQSYGHLMLFTDGVDDSAIAELRKTLSAGVTLSILGVATTESVPVPSNTGGFLTSQTDEPVLTRINVGDLQNIARDFGGSFALIKSDSSDIQSLVQSEARGDVEDSLSELTDQWLDLGFILAMVMMPLILMLFRRGLIYFVPLVMVSTIAPIDPAIADTQQSLWHSMWNTNAQYARQQYRGEDYQEAAAAFAQSDSITATYNQANALALSGDLESALDNYNNVLERDPAHEDAAFNKKLVEDLLEQQSSQNQNSDNSESSEDQQDSESQENESQQNKEQQGQSSSDDQQQDSQDQPSSESPESDGSESPGEQEQEQESDTEQDQNEETSEDDNQQSTDQEPSEQDNNDPEDQEPAPTMGMNEEENPLNDDSEQWLRTIPDDPSGFLRRKFEYQARQRARDGKSASNNQNEPRY